ncbi:hypothetical protein, partial [Tritonibacter sp. SIMBA_163]|uniref:hypothetical protein n=1 Tax=Tritonibacter sp. SIMBA_163 TaxID=3080868 RepID=UPI00397F9AC6
RFADSQWLMLGPASESFYSHPDFPELLRRSLRVMYRGRLVERARSENPLARSFRHTLGVTHVGGKYHFTDDDFLNEGARVLEKLGTKTIKIWL